MRILSVFGRAALRSPFHLGSTVRGALPVLAAVAVKHQRLSSAVVTTLSVSHVNQEIPFNMLSLVVAGSMISVLAQSAEPSECMGKRKKKDSQLADDMYEVDHIKARKLEKGHAKYLIHWKDYDDTHDSWEPLANLCGFEPDIAAFEAKQKKGRAPSPSQWYQLVAL